ncbi:predicted protein [Naegleria gruberi]|uniref:Predicted protein n=1 Tax=Naegleria gruberi TaxID=5762 RepID=D2W679_NAEGR|nr:uncharacterized protein NAEGRDRAFT_76922 [Naegleria gruberi]EFC35424.1 predicted protein [Naegleria gruberi]|eukprot:XP_002668168.1 predicted protein [Naegleria gruberi strain NEG-M]
MKIGIFGGCNTTRLTPVLEEELKVLASLINTEQHLVVYGGGKKGVMSIVPKYFHERGGRVISINTKEANNGLDECYGENFLYDTLQERQRRLIENSELVICLPGGIGTISELFDVMAMNNNKIRNVKILLYNFEGFFNHMIEQIKLLGKNTDEYLIVTNEVNDLMERLKELIKIE